MMTSFCGATSRCICSVNYAFTSDHAHAAQDDADRQMMMMMMMMMMIIMQMQQLLLILMLLIILVFLLLLTLVSTMISLYDNEDVAATTARQGRALSALDWSLDGIFMRAASWNGAVAFKRTTFGRGRTFLYTANSRVATERSFRSGQVFLGTFGMKFLCCGWF